MEFHNPAGDFHQVDITFRCTVIGSAVSTPRADAERIVTDVDGHA